MAKNDRNENAAAFASASDVGQLEQDSYAGSMSSKTCWLTSITLPTSSDGATSDGKTDSTG